MKILLCADLHLASKMQSGLSSSKAVQRRHELLFTFKNLINSAKELSVDCVLIAGDLFDTDRVSQKNIDYVRSCIGDALGIEFFCIAGNHDRESISKLSENAPENLHFFGDSWKSYTVGDLCISARDLLSADMYDTLSLSDECYNVVMLHGMEVQSSTHTDDSVIISRFENKGIDLLALGHLHYYHSYPLAKGGAVCYPGTPEGRGFDECGKKGFVIIDTEKAPLEGITFIESAKRTLHDIEVKIDQNDLSLIDFERKVLTSIQGIPADDIVRITLTGSFFAEAQKDIPYLENLLEERFFHSAIKDSTSLYIDINDYVGDVTLKGEFIRCISELEGDPDFLRDVAECGIKALRGDDIE